MEPGSTNNSADDAAPLTRPELDFLVRWQRYDTSPPVPRRSAPGKVIAVSIVLAVRGTLGLLLLLAILVAVDQHSVHERFPQLVVQNDHTAAWYTLVIWFQMAICAGEIASGLLLWRGRDWPRTLGLGVLWLDIAVAALIMLATSFSVGGLVGIAVDAVILCMLSWSTVRDWCF